MADSSPATAASSSARNTARPRPAAASSSPSVKERITTEARRTRRGLYLSVLFVSEFRFPTLSLRPGNGASCPKQTAAITLPIYKVGGDTALRPAIGRGLAGA